MDEYDRFNEKISKFVRPRRVSAISNPNLSVVLVWLIIIKKKKFIKYPNKILKLLIFLWFLSYCMNLIITVSFKSHLTIVKCRSTMLFSLPISSNAYCTFSGLIVSLNLSLYFGLGITFSIPSIKSILNWLIPYSITLTTSPHFFLFNYIFPSSFQVTF